MLICFECRQEKPNHNDWCPMKNTEEKLQSWIAIRENNRIDPDCDGTCGWCRGCEPLG